MTNVLRTEAKGQTVGGKCDFRGASPALHREVISLTECWEKCFAVATGEHRPPGPPPHSELAVPPALNHLIVLVRRLGGGRRGLKSASLN